MLISVGNTQNVINEVRGKVLPPHKSYDSTGRSVAIIRAGTSDRDFLANQSRRWTTPGDVLKATSALSRGALLSRRWGAKAYKTGDISDDSQRAAVARGGRSIPRPTNGNLTPSTVSVDIRATL